MPATARNGLVRWVALIAIELLIGIHVALTPMHLDEKFYVGVLFTIGNAAFFVAMLFLISVRLRLIGWLLGAATCVVEFGGFIASRTVGLPEGYKETWASAPEDLLGLISLVAEVVFVAAAAYALRNAATKRFATVSGEGTERRGVAA
ncbi:MAG: hypothetical protein ACRDV3_00280 [Acidothermaceae bacterium]